MKRIHPNSLYWNKDFSGFFTKVSTSFVLPNIYSVFRFIASTAKRFFCKKYSDKVSDIMFLLPSDLYRALRRNTMGQ